jgi:hypothetical protein
VACSRIAELPVTWDRRFKNFQAAKMAGRTPFPNWGTRALKLCLDRLSADGQAQHGHPLVALQLGGRRPPPPAREWLSAPELPAPLRAYENPSGAEAI